MQSQLTTKNRIEVIDVLRGIAMALMALDHTRDYFSNFLFHATDLNHTTLALFLTRWITNFCAPIFILLVGTSMSIAMTRGKSKNQIAFFLFTRGIWMIIAELTLIHFAWSFTLDTAIEECQVIWVIGLAMIFLAAFIYLPKWLILVISLIIVAGHNFLDGKELALLGSWSFLHAYTDLQIIWPTTIKLQLAYPLIPWIAVPALGYLLGNVFTWTQVKRAKFLFILGLVCTLTFVLLRYSNYYGDPIPWSQQKNRLFTFLSFLNCWKYPPSLLYLLMTIGPVLMVTPLLERCHNRLTEILAIFGKVPFFYYFLHLMLIHGLAVLFSLIRFGNAKVFIGNQIFLFEPEAMASYGYSLPIVYAIWLLVLAILFPLCRWYAKVKQRHKNSLLLSYL